MFLLHIILARVVTRHFSHFSPFSGAVSLRRPHDEEISDEAVGTVWGGGRGGVERRGVAQSSVDLGNDWRPYMAFRGGTTLEVARRL